MENEIESIVNEIQQDYRNKFKADGEIFAHLLQQIAIHTVKLARLREHEDMPGRFKREVADMYLFALGLIKLEEVDNLTIKESAEYYLNKVRKIYGINQK